MQEPTITCPRCETSIKLTDSLASPMIAAAKQQFEKKLADFQSILQAKEMKLVEAQNAQAHFLKKERELHDAKRELELTIEKRVQQNLQTVWAQAKREAEAGLQLKVAEKEHTILAMQKQIEELRRKAEQGSQQLQGEVQELQLEALLHEKFPGDHILPVPKGEFGGDVIQRVCTIGGTPVGSILWESKRTKHWSDGWLVKLREDQRAAKAEISVIVSTVLPKDISLFEHKDGVWVVHPSAILPLTTALRHGLLEVGVARQANEGHQTKKDLVYQYLTGPRFRQRVEAIVEAFSSMQEDLDKERKAIMKQWAKREEQIERVMGATVGMYGDLQGIAGKSIQEIAGLELEPETKSLL
jgi:hypothetical protein